MNGRSMIAGTGRIVALDLARTLALAGMVVFHSVRDLETFGLVSPGTTGQGLWYLAARLIAGSFLAIAGASLVLAHRGGIDRAAFAARLARIVAAAALVSLATRIAMPEVYVRFGILHCIALASVIGLAFLGRNPVWPAIAAVAALVLPSVASSPAFDSPWLIWTGLATTWPPMLDYLPILPWAGPFLAGMALAGWADRAGFLPTLARLVPRGAAWARLWAWPGRHSLAIYLVHQPVLFGLAWALARVLA